MSQHKSLQGSSGIVVKRNVLKRFERIDLLKKRGFWKAGDRVRVCARPSRTFDRLLHDLVQRLLAWYQHSLQTGGYPYIVFLMALESSFVPLPSEFIIPPAVIFVGQGSNSMSLPGIVLAATLGSWIGASFMYWAARFGGRPLIVGYGKWLERRPFLMRYGSFLLITPEKIDGAERWSERFGSFGIFLSRMLPVVRHLIGIPAGVIRMQYWRFSLYTVLGSLFWCAVLTYISFVAGKDERLMHGEIREVTIWAAAAAVILGGAYYFLVYRMSKKKA